MRFFTLAALTLLALLPTAVECAAPAETSPACKAWQLGQLAMDRDRFDEAIGQFQLSLRLDPTLVRNHLSLAAVYLALGQEAESLPHLASYLAARPDHFLIRWHYAEVLLNTDHPAEAQPSSNASWPSAGASADCRRPPDRLSHPVDGNR